LPNKIGAVITGGDFQGLGVLRTLARKGIPVILLDHEHCIGKYSKYKKRFFRSPRPSEGENYLNFLLQLAKREGIQGWIIFPNSDEAVRVLSQHKEILENYYRIPTPYWESIRNVYIKRETYKVAEKNGISIPKIYDINSLEQLVESDLQYPLVIKPSIRDHFFNKTKIKAFRVNTKEELIKTYQRVRGVIEPDEILVQDFIPGGPKNLYSFCPFFKSGKVITGVAGRRARQHPMDFGHASTYVELVDIPELRGISEKFLGLIDYYGIAEVEFMQDPRDNQYKLIEVNPRVWGWHTLAIAAGVDLPYLLYQDMIGEEIEVLPSIKQMKWVRLITDIPTVFAEIMNGNMKLSDYILSMKGKKKDAVLCLKDPFPFLAEIALIPYLWVKRGF
jgi:predicted ATP-grasp superfamily ATP-dependent carboligase